MAGPYWVVGGDYADATCTKLVNDGEEEKLGPYPTYEAAHDAWQSRAWATVDSCVRRYRILNAKGEEVGDKHH